MIDTSSAFKFSYGLFVLTAKQDNKDNGCIINTAIQQVILIKFLLRLIKKILLTI